MSDAANEPGPIGCDGCTCDAGYIGPHDDLHDASCPVITGPCVCGPDHDCRALGCSDECEACCE